MRYFEDLREVTEGDVLCVPIEDYDLVLGLPWFKTRNPEIDWVANRVLGLRTPQGIIHDPNIENSAEEAGCRPNRIDIGLLTEKSMSEYLDANSEDIADIFYMKIGYVLEEGVSKAEGMTNPIVAASR